MAVFEVRLITVLILVVYTQPTSAYVDCSKAWMHPTPDCDADVRIGRLEKLLEKANAKISSLENTCVKKKLFEKAETKINQQADKLKKAEARITQLSTKLKQADVKVYSLEQVTTNQKRHLSTIQSTYVKKSQLSHSPPGTFSSYLSGKHTYSKQQRVIFPHIIYNSGGYSSRTGIFTAPVSAVYVLNLNLVGCYGGYLHFSVRVMKGSRLLGYVGIGYNNNKERLGTGSGTIITTVMRGEKVRVEALNYSGKSLCLYGGSYNGYVYFSGYPIQYIQ